MQLGISSAADPTASADELIEACLRRGLFALELRCGDAAARPDGLAAALRRGEEAGVRLTGILTDGSSAGSIARSLPERPAVPLLLAVDGPHSAALAAAEAMRAAGTAALPLLRGGAGGWLDDVGDAPFAWQIDDAVHDAAADAALILQREAKLACVRLLGGGPETALQHGRGIGPLMRRLAMAGYSGPLIVTPSDHRYRIAWSVWLGRRGGWGCGSAGASHNESVPLAAAR
jgi:hypothetical protein